jgi:predicted nucleic acid-binding protein
VLLLIDTSVLIDHLRGDERAVGRLQSAIGDGDELWSVSVVRTEVLAGARPDEDELIGRLLDQLRWLEVTTDLADAAGRLASQYLRSHRGVDTVDFLVAAGVQKLGATLLTQNVRHFPMLENLQPAY